MMTQFLAVYSGLWLSSIYTALAEDTLLNYAKTRSRLTIANEPVLAGGHFFVHEDTFRNGPPYLSKIM